MCGHTCGGQGHLNLTSDKYHHAAKMFPYFELFTPVVAELSILVRIRLKLSQSECQIELNILYYNHFPNPRTELSRPKSCMELKYPQDATKFPPNRPGENTGFNIVRLN